MIKVINIVLTINDDVKWSITIHTFYIRLRYLSPWNQNLKETLRLDTMLLFYTVHIFHVSKFYYRKVLGSKESDVSDFLNWTFRTIVVFL
jgi:hypothetical protein